MISCAGTLAQTEPDDIRVLSREKSLAEQFLVLLRTFGPSDTSKFAKGIALYAEAKADFDGLITELEYDLEQDRPPNESEMISLGSRSLLSPFVFLSPLSLP